MRLNRIPTRWWVLVVSIGMFVALAPMMAPNDPESFALPLRLQGMSWSYPLGTDHMGRCVLSRLLYGFHVTPLSALLIVAISATVGSAIGLLSGYIGGITDLVVMRLVEGVFIFPAIGVALTISAVFGLGMKTMIIALGAVHWSEYARITRNLAVKEKQLTYILAAKTIGTSDARIVFRHILPNILNIILALVPYSMSWALLSFSGLSYLGLGASPGSMEWGLMIADGRSYMREFPMLVAAPGLLIVATVIVLNLLGDRLRNNFNRV